MGLNHLAANSRESAHRVLRRVAAEVGRCTCNGGSDENQESCTPENVGGCEIRCDEQRQREQRSKDRCMVDQQMEMCACKHGMSCWVCIDTRKSEATAPWPITRRLLMLGASRKTRSRSDGVGPGFDVTPQLRTAPKAAGSRATSPLRLTRSAPIDSS